MQKAAKVEGPLRPRPSRAKGDDEPTDEGADDPQDPVQDRPSS
jgi:hypothetical protein